MRKVFPTYRQSSALIISSKGEFENGEEAHFSGVYLGPEALGPEVDCAKLLLVVYRGETRDESYEFEFSQHMVGNLRDWCERTLYSMQNPDRHFEETTWKRYYSFDIPQRAGFDLHAFEMCEACFDECEECNPPQNRN